MKNWFGRDILQLGRKLDQDWGFGSRVVPMELVYDVELYEERV